MLQGLKFPSVDNREVVNRSGGMGDMHDGCDVSKVAATIGGSNAAGAFTPLLTTQLGERSAHVLKCMLHLSKDLALHQAKVDTNGTKAPDIASD